ncbi:MAG: copper amine oxidase N-terminal domain-containing protein [Bacillota bacterium]
MRKSRKLIAILATLALLATLLVPMVGPAAAASDNSVDRVLSVSSDYSGLASTLTIQEKSSFPNDFKQYDMFRLILPSGVKWNATYLTVNQSTYGNLVASGNAVVRSDQILEITLPGATSGQDVITVGLGVTVSSATGELKVTVDPMDSAVTGGSYTFAIVGTGKTTAMVESVPTIGQSGTGGKIRIDETAVGSMSTGNQTITLKLPSAFTWNGMVATDIVLGGGFATGTVGNPQGNDTSTLNIPVTLPTGRTQRGTIYITPKIAAGSSASYGDVSVSLSGTNVTDADLVIAKYSDWGVSVKVKEVKELLAGKFDGVKTEKITIEENVPGSLIQNRNITVELPGWVKITNVTDWSVSGGGLAATNPDPNVDGTKSKITIPITTSSSGDKGKIEFKLELSIEGNKTGDIEATISGAGITETKLVIAKAIAPVSAVAEAGEVKIGVQDQAAPDLTITENKKAAIEQTAETTSTGAAGEITLTLPDGVTFATTPKVEVTAGDLEINTSQARLTASNVFTIPVKSESIKPGTIKVSGIKLTVDRTVPEGAIYVKVGGNAIIENSRSAVGWVNGQVASGSNTTLDAGEFDTGTIAKVKLADCVSPAPVEKHAKVVFTISDTKYTVNGVEQTMDVAPYIKDGRTFMPVRYAAQAVGVTPENILYADGKVTLIKGDKVVQLTIGSNVMVINGVGITMDVPAEIKDGRTILPVSWLGKALGVKAIWDEATQTVTMEL